MPQAQFANFGAVNHPGVTQSSWNSCFACGGALDACTQVAGSPNATDQFSQFRGAQTCLFLWTVTSEACMHSKRASAFTDVQGCPAV